MNRTISFNWAPGVEAVNIYVGNPPTLWRTVRRNESIIARIDSLSESGVRNFNRAPKAADIPDAAIYSLVRSGVTSLYRMQDLLAGQYPAKVVLAKLRQMVNKGRLNGCKCGCRGDFSIPEGRENGPATTA